MSDRRLWLLLFLSSSIWLLVACAPAPPPPTATATVEASRVSEEQAGRLAIAVLSQSSPEMQPPLEVPQVHSLEQLTWREAQEHYGAALPDIAAVTPETAVWVVEMSGLWEGGMDAPGVTAVPTRYRSAWVILDATSGQTIVTSYNP